MDIPSVADIRKRFNEKPVMILGSPRPPMNNAESSDSSRREKLEQSKSNGSNRSHDDSNSTMPDSMASSSPAPHEISSSHDAKLARILHQGASNLTHLKNKSPAPLPSFDSRNENAQSGTSAISPDPMPHSITSPSPNSFSGFKKPHVALPNAISRNRSDGEHVQTSTTAQDPVSRAITPLTATSFTGLKKAPAPLPNGASRHRNEDAHSATLPALHDSTSYPLSSQSANNFTDLHKTPGSLRNSTNEDQYEDTSTFSQDSVAHPGVSLSAESFTGFKKPPVPLPAFASRDRADSTHSKSLSVSLDTILPSKCMFFELETTLNDYRRSDPRTIIHPRLKPTMPNITTNEINILQRYSNT